jgi:beta-glucosidase-like glycosyl hydrolase
MAAVNASLARTLQLRFEMGLFDPPADQPYWNVQPSEINTQAAQGLNLLATLSGLVLLRNDAALLPLVVGRRIAIIGPHATVSFIKRVQNFSSGIFQSCLIFPLC